MISNHIFHLLPNDVTGQGSRIVEGQDRYWPLSPLSATGQALRYELGNLGPTPGLDCSQSWSHNADTPVEPTGHKEGDWGGEGHGTDLRPPSGSGSSEMGEGMKIKCALEGGA